MRHFGIYANSGDVQTALNEEILVNPYVSLVSGALDYNTLAPACYIGEWSDNSQGTYTFQILDSADAAWDGGVNIGQLTDVYFNGSQTNMDVQLQFDGYSWHIYLIPEGGGQSDGESYNFTEGTPDTWVSNTMTDTGASTSPVSVDWDGTDTFVFTATQDYPLVMNTINPECSE